MMKVVHASPEPLANILNNSKSYIIPDAEVAHILPQNWAHYEYSHWNTDLVKENKEKLGNLILLESSLNKYAKNHVFSYKKDHAYKNSKFIVCQKLCDDQVWDLETFYHRDRECHTLLKEFFRKFPE